MSYEVKQGNVFGRLGTGIGRGLAETLPKEMERGRLAQGLQQFEQESANLTPIQQLARLSSIPGITPQMIQSFGDLAKQQQQRNAYSKFASGEGRENGRARTPIPQSSVRQQFQQQAAQIPFAGIQQNQSASPLNASAAQAGEPVYGTTSEINPVNPLGPQFEEVPAWSPQRRNQEIADILSSGITQDPGIASQIASQNEAAERSAPATAKENLSYLEQVRKDVRDEIDRQLQISTQKQGQEVFKDITGETRLLLERNIEKDLREHPNASKQEVVNRWIDRTREFIKTKPNLESLAKRDTFDFLFKHGNTTKKLNSYQKIYADNNAEEEFYNKLITKNTPDTTGFEMSPQGAAQIAFPLSKPINAIVQGYKRHIHENPAAKATAIASKIASNITDKDSLLSIVKNLRDKDPMFDQSTFFDYFRNNDVRLNSRQKNRELGVGESDILPSWGDEWINFRR